MYEPFGRKSLVELTEYAAHELRSYAVHQNAGAESRSAVIFGHEVYIIDVAITLSNIGGVIGAGIKDDEESIMQYIEGSFISEGEVAPGSVGSIGGTGYTPIRRMILEFVRRFFFLLRNEICKDTSSRSTKAKQASAQAVATAVAGSVASALNVAHPVAIGIASVAIIAIAASAKGAFCQMTEREVLAALGDRDASLEGPN